MNENYYISLLEQITSEQQLFESLTLCDFLECVAESEGVDSTLLESKLDEGLAKIKKFILDMIEKAKNFIKDLLKKLQTQHTMIKKVYTLELERAKKASRETKQTEFNISYTKFIAEAGKTPFKTIWDFRCNLSKILLEALKPDNFLSIDEIMSKCKLSGTDTPNELNKYMNEKFTGKKEKTIQIQDIDTCTDWMEDWISSISEVHEKMFDDADTIKLSKQELLDNKENLVKQKEKISTIVPMIMTLEKTSLSLLLQNGRNMYSILTQFTSIVNRELKKKDVSESAELTDIELEMAYEETMLELAELDCFGESKCKCDDDSDDKDDDKDDDDEETINEKSDKKKKACKESESTDDEDIEDVEEGKCSKKKACKEEDEGMDDDDVDDIEESKSKKKACKESKSEDEIPVEDDDSDDIEESFNFNFEDEFAL